jgi:exosortase
MENERKWDKSALGYVATAGLLILLAYPALIWLARTWATNPYYSHGFLVPILSALLAWRQWRWLRAEPRQGETWVGLSLTGASLALVIWALPRQDQVVAALALVILLLGILLFLEGWARVRHWLFPILFLALMVPLPFVDLASPWLEAFSARSAAALVRLVGIPALQQGGQLRLSGTTLIVGAPCSGLRSLIAMVTVAVGWLYLVRGRPAAKALMFLAVLPLVAFSNVLRIAILLIVAQFFGEQAAMTYFHDWSSPLLFMMALGLFLALGKVLGCSQVRDDIF